MAAAGAISHLNTVNGGEYGKRIDKVVNGIRSGSRSDVFSGS